MIDLRSPLAQLLARIADRLAGRPARPTAPPCYCDDANASECSGGGLPRGEWDCSCRCHRIEMPSAGVPS